MKRYFIRLKGDNEGCEYGYIQWEEMIEYYKNNNIEFTSWVQESDYNLYGELL